MVNSEEEGEMEKNKLEEEGKRRKEREGRRRSWSSTEIVSHRIIIELPNILASDCNSTNVR